jgi:hypothetical protein
VTVRLALSTLVLVVACGRNPQKTAPLVTTTSADMMPSWDLILNENDLSAYGAKIDVEKSDDFDYLGGNAFTLGNTVETKHRHSTSQHEFSSRLGDIEIELQVFKEPRYADAQMEMEMWSDTHRFDAKTPEGTSLHNYPTQAPADSIEENAFRSRIIHLDDAIGEQTACSQWESFAPKVRFSMRHVVAEVSVGGFGTEHLDDAVLVARMQEAKLRRLMGSTIGRNSPD